MAWTAVQRKGKGTNAASISIGAGDGWATPTAGNLLVVTANSDATVTITNIGTAWTAGPSVVDGNGAYIWWKISEGTESTITCTPSVSDTICITTCEYSGNLASPFDTSNSSTNANNGNNVTTSTSVTTTADGDLIIAVAALHLSSGFSSAPTGPSWTNSFVNQISTGTGGTALIDCYTFYAELMPAGAAAAYATSAAWTNNVGDRQELVIAFKAAATAAATYPPQRPRSREPVPLRVAKTRQTIPVRAQVNPPYPVQEIDQTRRLRGLLLRRGKLTQTVRPQVNPPYPFVEVVQERRLRGAPVRRGRQFSPTWPQQAAAQAPAFIPDRPHRTRLLLALRREHTIPPPPADTPVFAARRDRPVFPPWRRSRSGLLVPADSVPPAGAKRDRPPPPFVRRGRGAQFIPNQVGTPVVPMPGYLTSLSTATGYGIPTTFAGGFTETTSAGQSTTTTAGGGG